jgi:5-formyltetrahydrofolate cyclo-ligase
MPVDPRQVIRKQIRQARQQLSAFEQQQAAQSLCQQFLSLPELSQSQHIAIYLHNDGEIATTELITALWQLGKSVYLPILHPFTAGYLVFQRYQARTTMTANKYGIAEPKLNCEEIKVAAELDLILTPLVAFDAQGQRMGMGGGFYDRTFANQPLAQRRMIGLAHDCQRVENIPAEVWDLPLPVVVTPSAIYRF